MLSRLFGPTVFRWVVFCFVLIPHLLLADDGAALLKYSKMHSQALLDAVKKFKAQGIPIDSVEMQSARLVGNTRFAYIEATSIELAFKVPCYVMLEIGNTPLSGPNFTELLELKLNTVVYIGMRRAAVTTSAPIREKYTDLLESVKERITELRAHRTGLETGSRKSGSYFKKMLLEQEQTFRRVFKEIGKIEFRERSGVSREMDMVYPEKTPITEAELQARQSFLQDAQEAYIREIQKLKGPGAPKGGIEVRNQRIKMLQIEHAKVSHALRILGAYSIYHADAGMNPSIYEKDILDAHLRTLADLKVTLQSVFDAFKAKEFGPAKPLHYLEQMQAESVEHLEKLVDQGLRIKGYVPTGSPMSEIVQLTQALARFDKVLSLPKAHEVAELHERSMAILLNISTEVRVLTQELEMLKGKNLAERTRMAAITTEIAGLQEVAAKVEVVEKSFRRLKGR